MAAEGRGMSAQGTAPAHPSSLMINRCVRCAALLAPLTASCPSCQGSELRSVPSSGAGSIVSWKVADHRPDEARGDSAPSAVGIVELDDGPRIYTWIDGEVPAGADRDVRVEFQPTAEDGRFPVFAVRQAS
ncbi:OB-fold domain-containing protein [Rhodococcus sp. PvR099]|uniref:Zn-ribbon domain-containing OB-fold protein n=1 Tax=Rhodococcus sp. PvR099 TaxID=2806602 RepID=UPI001B40B699|nr:OB-fold domain-containing protein [Rhodococcus sp. PvR099]MBP1161783.1 putative OB-fold protein [Rhodococcus sp. PvR099]